MPSVMPSARNGSVSTAPAATNGSSMVLNTSTAHLAASSENRRRPSSCKRANMPSSASHDGRRRLISLIPNQTPEAAWAQKAKGGLPQKGSPGANQGVIQSPAAAMIRAISA
ncbi:hypothetical protein G6F59_018387 [Rhizopus arrhizus]|nr:hypothetical protein G6F59_018387 [Rhizopus arrhizus]